MWQDLSTPCLVKCYATPRPKLCIVYTQQECIFSKLNSRTRVLFISKKRRIQADKVMPVKGYFRLPRDVKVPGMYEMDRREIKIFFICYLIDGNDAYLNVSNVRALSVKWTSHEWTFPCTRV